MARNPTGSAQNSGKTVTVTVFPDNSVTVKDAATLLGVTAQTIRNWFDAGAPHFPGSQGRNNPTRVSLRALMSWREAQALDAAGIGEDGYNEDRARAADWHYRAIKRQADARKELGSLVAVDDIAVVVAEDYERVRSRLNSVPSRVSVQIAAESDPSTVRLMLSKAINEALSNLSAIEKIIEEAGGDPEASVNDVLDLDAAEIHDVQGENQDFDEDNEE